jgi:hypothetical protein
MSTSFNFFNYGTMDMSHFKFISDLVDTFLVLLSIRSEFPFIFQKKIKSISPLMISTSTLVVRIAIKTNSRSIKSFYEKEGH